MRVLLFGVDGLTFDIVNPYMERGLLPNFQRLRDGGAQGVLQSLVLPMTPPAWMSIATGLSPAKHGVYDFWEYEKTENNLQGQIVTHRKGGKAVWNILSDWGKRVLVLNVPLTYPPEPVNGIMLSGYMAPDMKSGVTYPVSFKDELLAAIPDYKIDIDPSISSAEKGDVFVETLDVTRTRTQMFRLMLTKPWDFLFVTYVGADRIQHLRWDEIMAFHPLAVEYYQKLDEALGLALDALDKDDLLMLVSDHGFRGIHHRFYLQEYLHRRGLQRMRDTTARQKVERVDMVKRMVRKVVWGLKLQGIAHGIRRQFRSKGLIETKQEAQPVKLPDLDWANTKAWIPGYSGAIAGYANVFLDDSMTEEQIEELVTAIREIRNPATGQPLALEIHREDSLGTGEFAPKERHLIVLAGEDITIINKLGHKSLWESVGGSMGIHHPDGVLYLYGAGVKQGTTIAPTHLYDVVPTILSFMHMPLPDELEGAVINEAFEQPVSQPKKAESNSVVRNKLRKLATQNT